MSALRIGRALSLAAALPLRARAPSALLHGAAGTARRTSASTAARAAAAVTPQQQRRAMATAPKAAAPAAGGSGAAGAGAGGASGSGKVFDFSDKTVCRFLKPNAVHESNAAFVAESADVMGAVTLGTDASVWYGCVVRGDINTISIGARSNVQDGATIHVTDELPVQVGSGVTVGHRALLHGCTIADDVLVGMGAIVMDAASVGPDSIVAAGAVVTPGKHFPAGSMIVGAPAKRVRDTTAAERDLIRWSAAKYVKTAHEHDTFQHDHKHINKT